MMLKMTLLYGLMMLNAETRLDVVQARLSVGTYIIAGFDFQGKHQELRKHYNYTYTHSIVTVTHATSSIFDS